MCERLRQLIGFNIHLSMGSGTMQHEKDECFEKNTSKVRVLGCGEKFNLQTAII